MTGNRAESMIRRVRKQKRLTMTETEAKTLLGNFGVPVVPGRVFIRADEAVRYARKTGFPVVVKGSGAKLSHKTERGLVKTNLKTAREVREAFRAVRNAAGDDWEGCLVAPFIEGRREFVAGLIRDAQFGPVVMFGLGGIFTEALSDTAFRIAPLDEKEARRMIGEISSRKLLAEFRGEAQADVEGLVAVLLGLSRLSQELPDVREVDINPLIITPRGKVAAVDALVVLTGPEEKDAPAAPRRVSRKISAALDTMTHPQSVAVIGATRTHTEGFPGMFACIADFGFAGELYPINPRADEILGRKAYPSVTAIGKPVDLVVISVPAPKVPDALRDCIASGSKNVHIFSSGFKESGEEEGIRLQREIEAIAREGGLHVVGPNCMGLYVPASRLVTWLYAPRQSGPVAFVSQSGGNAQDYTWYAAEKLGVHFSKVFSYGNALTLDSTDFLDYLETDDETKIVTMYLEGVKDGRRLLGQVRRINKTKPVIMIKAGLTESGARAVASHTGSMAGGEKIWNAFFRQTGAVRVESLEEMAETALAFERLGRVRGRGVAVIGTGGGIGVAAADACAREGLNLAAFPEDLMAKLRAFIPPAGNMIRNPLDAHLILIEPELLGRALDLLSAQPWLDMFIISLHMDWLFSRGEGAATRRIAEYIADEARRHTEGKPLVVALRQFAPSAPIRHTLDTVKSILLAAGVPFYDGIPKAASALAKMVKYYEFQKDGKKARFD
ncbi:MAG: acetate--CoA ligase family protein [Syntrophaceae bacterium]|nr:acetate--CoA ligase family protein [Syntrophaceae bacterium]